ncbi:MAG: siroheme synthase [Alphaproteobacteria bacterium]|nr:siroheme synthase [Alphaproteobacteria bacterium]
MRYFPIFFDLQDRKVVVIGGGEEALRKIRLLLKTPAQIQVIAPVLHDELAAETRVEWVATVFRAELLEGAALVYSADPELNATVSQAAQARGIPVNAVDQADISTFIVPSIVDRDPLVVAIGTEGAAPVLGQGIRAKIDALLPPHLGELASKAAALRKRVATEVPHGHARRSFWSSFFFGAPKEHFLSGDKAAFELALNDAIYDAAKPKAGHVAFVAIGPGEPDLLTLKAHRALMEADVMVSDDHLPPAILELARRDAVRMSAPLRSRDIEALLLSQVKAGHHVVRLISGTEQNIQAEAEYVMMRAQSVSASLIPGLGQVHHPVQTPFPTNLDIQDQILRSAS